MDPVTQSHVQPLMQRLLQQFTQPDLGETQSPLEQLLGPEVTPEIVAAAKELLDGFVKYSEDFLKTKSVTQIGVHGSQQMLVFSDSDAMLWPAVDNGDDDEFRKSMAAIPTATRDTRRQMERSPSLGFTS